MSIVRLILSFKTCNKYVLSQLIKINWAYNYFIVLKNIAGTFNFRWFSDFDNKFDVLTIYELELGLATF